MDNSLSCPLWTYQPRDFQIVKMKPTCNALSYWFVICFGSYTHLHSCLHYKKQTKKFLKSIENGSRESHYGSGSPWFHDVCFGKHQLEKKKKAELQTACSHRGVSVGTGQRLCRCCNVFLDLPRKKKTNLQRLRSVQWENVHRSSPITQSAKNSSTSVEKRMARSSPLR